MNEFPTKIKSKDIKSAKAEVLQYYQDFCSDNPVLSEINEAKSIEDLSSICSLMNGLSVFLARADFVKNGADCSVYLRAGADEFVE